MATVGVIGLGDMGSGLARNLIAHGFSVTGHDLIGDRMAAFAAMGGHAAADAAGVGVDAEIVYIMVMNGEEVTDGMDLGLQGYESVTLDGKVIFGKAFVNVNKDNMAEYPF